MGYFTNANSSKRGKDEYGKDMNVNEWRRKVHEQELREIKNRRARNAEYSSFETNYSSSGADGCGLRTFVVGAGFCITVGAFFLPVFDVDGYPSKGQSGVSWAQNKYDTWTKNKKANEYYKKARKNLEKLKKEYKEEQKQDSLKKLDSINNKTSSLHFDDNKALVLFPEHVATLNQDNTLNPQWRLQLG